MVKAKKQRWKIVFVVLVALVALLVIGLKAYVQRVWQTAMLPERDFVAEYREMRGEVATEADGVWWKTIDGYNSAFGKEHGEFNPLGNYLAGPREAIVEKYELSDDVARNLSDDIGILFRDEVWDEYAKAVEYEAGLTPTQPDPQHVYEMTVLVLEGFENDDRIQTLIDLLANHPSAIRELEGDQVFASWFNAYPPRLNGLRHYESTLVRIKIERGEYEDAIRRFQRLLALSRAVKWDCSGINVLVGNSIEVSSLRSLSDALDENDSHPEWVIADLAEAIGKHRDQVDHFEEFRRVLDRDMLEAREQVYWFFDASGTGADSFWAPRKSDMPFVSRLEPGECLELIDVYEDHVDNEIDRLELMDRLPGDPVVEPSDSLLDLSHPRYQLLRNLLGHHNGLAKSISRVVRERDRVLSQLRSY